MTSHVPAKLLRFAIVPVFVLALAAPAWSQEDTGLPKQGGFAGVSFMPNFTFDGKTFDGQTYYKQIDGEELAILPQLDKRNLFRFVLGYRFRQASIEASYERTRHDGAFLGLTGQATFQAVNLDGRLFLATRARVQPHLLLGASLPFFTVTDGSFLNTQVGDARWRGWGVNSEAGLTFFPHRQFALSVGYRYRWIWFDRMTGVSNTLFELRPRFRETTGGVVVTSYVIF